MPPMSPALSTVRILSKPASRSSSERIRTDPNPATSRHHDLTPRPIHVVATSVQLTPNAMIKSYTTLLACITRHPCRHNRKPLPPSDQGAVGRR